MKRLNAYRKCHFGFLNKESEEGDIYFNEEWRFNDYDNHQRKEQDPGAVQR